MNTVEISRQEYIEELRVSYMLGEVSIDPDDPRTVVGLTEEEVNYIRGER